MHAEVEVVSDRGRTVAAALGVLRTKAGPLANRPPGPPPTPFVRPGEERSLVSPFSQSMGLEVRGLEPGTATLAMRRDLNEGLDASIDPGALVAMADTCAALACLPSIDERLSGSATLGVGEEHTAPRVGSGRVRVLATPVMINLIEAAALDAVEKLLPSGHQSLGTVLNVRHIAATPVGMRVTATAEVTQVEGRTIRFRVEARDARELIGDGTHERVVVNVAKFDQRVQRKL